jgi:tetratricopeptide (TPR) repeat protein
MASSKSLRLSAGGMTAVPAALALVAALALAGSAAAQQAALSTPPSGGNQRATVTQGIGLVRVSIDYSSPHVHSPSGEDRRGKIWGGLVPYGMANLGFGTCGEQCPWRGGANENTVFTTTHDIKVQGQPLPAGSYGLHFIPGKDEWTVVFSKNSTSWGSFFYDVKEDALRVQAKPAKSEYHEDLAYEFRDRRPDHASAVLRWEDLELPLAITVDNPNELYYQAMRRELRNSAGFSAANWNAAAQFSLTNKIHLEEGLRAAEQSVNLAQGGEENFTNLITLADLQEVNHRADDARKTRDRAVHHATATAIQLHLYGRQLMAAKKSAEAMEIFELNAKLHPDTWPVHVGLARGHSALGHYKEALAEAKLALPQAPDDPNRRALQGMIEKLGQGKDVN